MADERGPYRLNRERVRALAGAGVPNANIQGETMEPSYVGTIGIADVSTLSAPELIPQVGVRYLTAAAAAGRRAVCEIIAPEGGMWVHDVGGGGNVTLYINTGTAPAATLVAGLGTVIDARTFTPSVPDQPVPQVTINTFEDTAGTPLALVWNMQLVHWGLVPCFIPAGNRFYITHFTVAVALDVSFLLQFPRRP